MRLDERATNWPQSREAVYTCDFCITISCETMSADQLDDTSLVYTSLTCYVLSAAQHVSHLQDYNRHHRLVHYTVVWLGTLILLSVMVCAGSVLVWYYRTSYLKKKAITRIRVRGGLCVLQHWLISRLGVNYNSRIGIGVLFFKRNWN